MSAALALTPVFDGPGSTNEEILACIAAAIEGDYRRRPSGQDEISIGLSKLLETLEVQANRSLDNVVDVSVNVNETSVMSARLLHDLRGIDDLTQTMAAAAEEMAATIGEIDNHGQQIAAHSKSTLDAVGGSVRVTQDVSSRMDMILAKMVDADEKIGAIRELAGKIDTLASGIRKIASQTNLLAINAAVEAARAGDAGRGFAVVATEVKALSDRTTAATDDIAKIVRGLNAGMETMVASMEACGNAAREGNAAVAELQQSMGHMEGRSREMADSATQIAESLRQQGIAADEVAGGVAAVAGRAANASGELEGIIDLMVSAQEAVNKQVIAVSKMNLRKKVEKLAQSDHVIWKRRLANMIVGKEGLRADELANHRSCRLGQWYYSASDAAIVGQPEFPALEEPHERVHSHGLEVVRLYNAGNIEAALEALNEVESASDDVLRLLQRMAR